MNSLGREKREFELRDDFIFGTATSGFQIEGGFNGPGEPRNNWYEWEVSGRVEPSGIAVDFWNRYEEILDRASSIGLNAFRFGIEWTRVEPESGEINFDALDQYKKIALGCIERSMEPLVTLHHFTHPYWLGQDFWLKSESPILFKNYVKTVVSYLDGVVSNWVTINEMNVLNLATYFFGVFPPGIKGSNKKAIVAISNLMAAHIEAYETIKEINPQSVVSTNNSCMSIYEFDKMVLDIFAFKHYGVDVESITEWLKERRSQYYASLPRYSNIELRLRDVLSTLFGCRDPKEPIRLFKDFVKDCFEAHSNFANYAVALEAVERSDFRLALDYVGIDYYDPIATNHVVMPFHKTDGGRVYNFAKPLWEDPSNPEGLVSYSKSSVIDSVPLWIVENGMCNRVKNGRSFIRKDGMTRPRFLKDNIAGVVKGIESGLDVRSYFHWSLIDNYEWGSYQPRFGIFGVDRERGCKVLKTDSMGYDSAKHLKNIIEGLKKGDISVVGL